MGGDLKCCKLFCAFMTCYSEFNFSTAFFIYLLLSSFNLINNRTLSMITSIDLQNKYNYISISVYMYSFSSILIFLQGNTHKHWISVFIGGGNTHIYLKCWHTNTFTHNKALLIAILTHWLSLISLLAAVIITDGSDEVQQKREQVKKLILWGRESTTQKGERGKK